MAGPTETYLLFGQVQEDDKLAVTTTLGLFLC